MTVRRLYWLTIAFGVAGCIAYSVVQGFRLGLAFLLGAGISLVNLWLFNYLAGSLAPSTSENKPWSARAFVSRYLLLFAGGYAIIRTLGVNPLPVVLGLLTSTAAVVAASIAELIRPSTP
jgi:hypothetical protein